MEKPEREVNGHAWFIGFLEKSDTTIYFATYLNDVENTAASNAKDISVTILEDYKTK